MPLTANYLFIVGLDVDPDKEALFNEVYEEEHFPALLSVPGVVSGVRLRTEDVPIMLGGREQRLGDQGQPKYLTIYEIESPDVLMSEAWNKAGEHGRWASEVRPFTRNRSLMVRKTI